MPRIARLPSCHARADRADGEGDALRVILREAGRSRRSRTACPRNPVPGGAVGGHAAEEGRHAAGFIACHGAAGAARRTAHLACCRLGLSATFFDFASSGVCSMSTPQPIVPRPVASGTVTVALPHRRGSTLFTAWRRQLMSGLRNTLSAPECCGSSFQWAASAEESSGVPSCAKGFRLACRPRSFSVGGFSQVPGRSAAATVPDFSSATRRVEVMYVLYAGALGLRLAK